MGVKGLGMGLGNPDSLEEGQIPGTATPTSCRQAKKVKAEINGKLKVIGRFEFHLLVPQKLKNKI
jgi:hypothetical protein